MEKQFPAAPFLLCLNLQCWFMMVPGDFSVPVCGKERPFDCKQEEINQLFMSTQEPRNYASPIISAVSGKVKI